MNYGHGKEAEDQFQRLPNDIVVNIFDKVSDIKWLCRCLVVSKRFSYLIPLVQTLSIRTNAWDYLSIPRSDYQKLAVLLPLRWNDSCVDSFAKLTQVRSLNLDLVSDFNTNNDSVFKWGAKLTSNLDSITFLYAASLSKMIESEEEEESEGEGEGEGEEEKEEEEEEDDDDDETENEITQEEFIRRLPLAIECLAEALLWVGILSPAVWKYPMLQSITITDSMNKGVRLYLGGEKLVEHRNARKCLKEAASRMRAGYVPVLRLPMSGYVMERVTIVQFKLYSGDYSEADLAMVDAFAEEQGVFLEAVVQILKNHKDSIKIFQNLN